MKAFAMQVAKGLLWIFAGLASLAVLIVVTGWIGSSIPRGEIGEPPQNPVVIMVESNGAHTELILPIANDIKDWREVFPTASNRVQGWEPTHISISFGEREVFLNTPTLADLKLTTALRVAGLGGDGLIRVSNRVHPRTETWRRPLSISEAQYARLVAAIESDLPKVSSEGRAWESSRYDEEPYYESTRGYTVWSTCNQWTSDRLAEAGIRTGYWTPFAGGVMKWVPPASAQSGAE